MRKLKLAEQFSDIDTSEKDDTEKKLCRRERAKKRHYTSDSNSESEESCINQEITRQKIPPLPKKCKRTATDYFKNITKGTD